MLSAHPHLMALPYESTAFAHWKQASYQGKTRWRPQRLDRFYRYIVGTRIPQQAYRFCEKTPNNVRALDKILDFFDQKVHIIHLIRDGRDVVLSRHPDQPQSYWIGPERWARDVQYGLAYRDHPQVSTVFYENLIRDYGNTIQQICDFLEEPCPEALYQWFTNAAVRQNRAFGGEVRQLHSQSLEKWRTTEDQQRVKALMADPEAYALLQQLGYPLA